jgi:hypothetical protein
VDQSGAPLPGVKVHGGVLLNNGFDSSRSEVYDTETDSLGLFSFADLHGLRFGVKLEKEGYAFNQNLYINWWNSYTPNPDNPAVFVMARLQGAQPMEHTVFDSRVPYDGNKAEFDLISGRKANGGDLQITLTRSPLNIRRGIDRFDWNVVIKEAGGGLLVASDPYPNEAPEGGYVPSFEYGVTMGAQDWTQRLTKTFYIVTAKGTYGRVNVDLTVDSERQDGTGITIESWLNPSGSRNLEFDPTQAIKPKALPIGGNHLPILAR